MKPFYYALHIAGQVIESCGHIDSREAHQQVHHICGEKGCHLLASNCGKRVLSTTSGAQAVLIYMARIKYLGNRVDLCNENFAGMQ
jgi:hypothetical protein